MRTKIDEIEVEDFQWLYRDWSDHGRVSPPVCGIKEKGVTRFSLHQKNTHIQIQK